MKMGWRELIRMKQRFTLMAIVTTLIVLLILMISGLADGLAYDNGAVVRNLPVEQMALSQDAEGQLTRSFLDQADQPSGTEALGVQSMVLEKKNGTKDDVTVFASPADTTYGPSQLSELKTGQVLVDTEYAKQSGTKVGDTITDFRTKTTFEIVGTVSDGRYSHAPVLWTTLNTWNTWQDKMKTNYVSAFLSQDPIKTDLATYTKKQIVEQVPGYSAEQNSFQMMRIALVLIGSLILTAFFYILTMQKMKQLGILKAIGIRTRTIGQGLVLQVFLLTVVSFLISLLLTWTIGQLLPGSLPFRFEWMTSFGYGGLIVLTAMLGSLIPLRALKKLEPADAMGGMTG
ncbi:MULTISPECIES: ABC transporter permease [Exiguobacterium]|uniref:ABC transporter permease n=1 Tax=Exiguobacterium TaxID=33986 RepID=UPI00047A25C6|nr:MULTISPECIES: ABC transporter permease [Exiguobacterium]MCK2156115.1 ABC transporter permease [Exiguobacterium sp. 17-1]